MNERKPEKKIEKLKMRLVRNSKKTIFLRVIKSVEKRLSDKIRYELKTQKETERRRANIVLNMCVQRALTGYIYIFQAINTHLHV